ncbi:MAG: hypothetical protein AAGI38_23270 [Bacteroidota bacterium]
MELIETYNLGFQERIFDKIMLSESEWLIRTRNKIVHFKDSIVKKTIQINQFGDIVDTAWGGDYAFCAFSNYAILIGIDRCFCWELDNYNFNESLIVNAPPEKYSNPSKLLRPFKASANEATGEIWVLFQSAVAGDSYLFASLHFAKDRKIKWSDRQVKNLRKDDYPIKKYQLVNDEYEAPNVSDICLIEEKKFCFTTGFHKAYGKYDMDYSILTEINNHQRSVFQSKCEESCFGLFSSDRNYLLLKPLHKNGMTKGKMYVKKLFRDELIPLKYPRGTAKYRILDIFGNIILMSNDSFGNYPMYYLHKKESLKLFRLRTTL